MNISLQRIFVWQTWTVPSCIQVKVGTCFTVNHFFSSCWPYSSTMMSIFVTSLGRSTSQRTLVSTSQRTLVSTVVDEHASLSDVCASDRWRTARTVPYRIFYIRSIGRILVRNSYRLFVASLIEIHVHKNHY